MSLLTVIYYKIYSGMKVAFRSSGEDKCLPAHEKGPRYRSEAPFLCRAHNEPSCIRQAEQRRRNPLRAVGIARAQRDSQDAAGEQHAANDVSG